MKDYQREELQFQAERARQHLEGDCPLLEDEVAIAAWEYIQELESDKRRLEWLILSNVRVWLLDGSYDIHDRDGTCIVYMAGDWRDAIDKAMQEGE